MQASNDDYEGDHTLGDIETPPVEETALVTRKESPPARNGGGALAQRPPAPAGMSTYVIGQALAAGVQEEVRGAIALAKEFPRDEDLARTKIMKMCEHGRFCEKAVYSYPRGGTTVKGGSVRLMREIAKGWGNIRYGAHIIADEDVPGGSRTVRCWAWDLETNNKVEADVQFRKLQLRKGNEWVPIVEERDILLVTNLNAAKGVRNCIEALLPWDLVDDAKSKVEATKLAKITKDPKAFLKRLLDGFAMKGVSPEELREFADCPLDQCQPKQLHYLDTMLTSIEEGHTRWSDWLKTLAKKEGVKQPIRSAKDLRDLVRKKAQDAGAGPTPGSDTPPAAPEGSGLGPDLPEPEAFAKTKKRPAKGKDTPPAPQNAGGNTAELFTGGE